MRQGSKTVVKTEIVTESNGDEIKKTFELFDQNGNGKLNAREIKTAMLNIGYDEKARAIGIKRHQPLSSMASYDFETREKNDWVRIGCKDFMKYLSTTTQIDFTKAKQFIAEYDEATETLIVVVDEAHMKK